MTADYQLAKHAIPQNIPLPKQTIITKGSRDAYKAPVDLDSIIRKIKIKSQFNLNRHIQPKTSLSTTEHKPNYKYAQH